MNTRDAGFDLGARRSHAAAVQQLSPAVRAQLARRTREALAGRVPRRAPLLPWAGAVTAGLALAFALSLRAPTPVRTPAGDATAVVQPELLADAEPDATLSEDPEFYLWLAEDGRSTLE